MWFSKASRSRASRRAERARRPGTGSIDRAVRMRLGPVETALRLRSVWVRHQRQESCLIRRSSDPSVAFVCSRAVALETSHRHCENRRADESGRTLDSSRSLPRIARTVDRKGCQWLALLKPAREFALDACACVPGLRIGARSGARSGTTDEVVRSALGVRSNADAFFCDRRCRASIY